MLAAALLRWSASVRCFGANGDRFLASTGWSYVNATKSFCQPFARNVFFDSASRILCGIPVVLSVATRACVAFAWR